MRGKSFFFIGLLCACILFIFLSSAPVWAAYSEIIIPEESSYVGGNALYVEGAAEPDEGFRFRRWILELGKADDVGDFVLIRELKRGTSRVGNSDNDDETDDYGVLLNSGDISDLVDEEDYILRLSVVDYDPTSGEESEAVSEVDFIKRSRTFTFKLIHSGGNSFRTVNVYLRGENGEDDLEWEDDSLPEDIVCKSGCIVRLDGLISDDALFSDNKVDMVVVAEDTSGKFFVFYKNYNLPASYLELRTGSTKKVSAPGFVNVFTQQTIPLDYVDLLIYGDYYEPTDAGDIFSLWVASDSELLHTPYAVLGYYGENLATNQLMYLNALFMPPWRDYTDPVDLHQMDLIAHRTLKDSDENGDDLYSLWVYDNLVKDGDTLDTAIAFFGLSPEKRYKIQYQDHVGNYLLSEKSAVVGTDFASPSSYFENMYPISGNLEFFKDPFHLSLSVGDKKIIGRLRDATSGDLSGSASGSGATITRPDRSTFTINNQLVWVFDECETRSCKIGDVYNVDWSLQGAFVDGRTLKTSDDFTFAGNRFIPGKVVPFLRGDGNNDRKVDLSDAIFILEYLFQGRAGPRCLDAADVNDDGMVDIADPIRLLFVLFQGAGPLPQPYPDYDSDPTPDDLPCSL